MNKKVRYAATAAIAGVMCLCVVGCSVGNDSVKEESGEAVSQVETESEDTWSVDDESPLKVDGISYDLTESQITLKLSNASSDESIGGISVKLLSTAMVNGNSEVATLDMDTYKGYIGFASDNADGYLAYDVSGLQGLVLEPGESATVTMDFVGTLHDNDGKVWVDKSDSCNIDGIAVDELVVGDYAGKRLVYDYENAEDMKPDYDSTEPSTEDSDAKAVDIEDYKFDMQSYEYDDDAESVKLTLKATSNADKDLSDAKLTYWFTNEYGDKQQFESELGSLKAGEVKTFDIVLDGVKSYNLAPSFESVSLSETASE